MRTYSTEPLYDPTVLRTVFLEFENEDWEKELMVFYHTDVEVPANVVIDGRTYRDVGIHFRGASSFFSVPAGARDEPAAPPYTAPVRTTRMAPLVLVTGFGPFAGLRHNPSAFVARDVGRARVPGARLVARVLPVSYAGAEERVVALCKRLRPDAVLSLGVAIGAPVICVETTALNRADFRVPDARGFVAETTPSARGAAARLATYDARAVWQALRSVGVPAAISHHAGTHLCNLTLYHFLSALPPDRPVGFLHLPLFPEQVVDLLGKPQRGRTARPPLAPAELPSMSRELQVRAVLAAVRVLVRAMR